MRRANLEFTDEELIDLISQLSSEGHIDLRPPEGSSSFSEFLADYSTSWWVYSILLLSLLEMLLVLYGSPNQVLVLVRQFLGLALLGFFPGYSTLKALFPYSELTILEQTALSIFLSILVSILAGTILGSFLLLQATSNVIVLTEFTSLMTLAASYRSFSYSKKNMSAHSPTR